MKKTKTRKELAAEYGISRKTFARRLEGIGIKLSQSRGVLLPIDLIQIYRFLGFPEKMPPQERMLWTEEMRAHNSLISQDDPK
ncbi:MAG: hypothetical protein QXP66_04435 [Candidatus Aenigmatarchaeota archaeon]